MGPRRSNRRIGGKKSLTHSPARSAALRSTALRSAPLRSAPLRSAPLRAAPLSGSFVSEKVAMYERDHMRRYAQIQPIVGRRFAEFYFFVGLFFTVFLGKSSPCEFNGPHIEK